MATAQAVEEKERRLRQNLVLGAVKERKLQQMKALKEKNEEVGMAGLLK